MNLFMRLFHVSVFIVHDLIVIILLYLTLPSTKLFTVSIFIETYVLNPILFCRPKSKRFHVSQYEDTNDHFPPHPKSSELEDTAFLHNLCILRAVNLNAAIS